MLNWLGPAIPTSLLIVLEVVLLLLALAVVPSGRRPASALAWILLIVVAPFVGLAAFATIGSPRLPARRRAMQRTMNERLEQVTRGIAQARQDAQLPAWLPAIVRLNRSTGAFPLVDGNSAILLTTIDEQLAAMIAAIDAAQQYVHVEFYILALDDTTRPVFAALARAVARGAEVRALLDHIGSRGYPGFRPALEELTRIGVDWRLMLPILPLQGRYQRPDLRNHRKLLVVDGTTAFVGSLNLIDPSYERAANVRRGLHWRDLLVQLQGPVVQEVKGVFSTDWFSETDSIPAPGSGPLLAVADDGDPSTALAQVVPSGPAFDSEINLALFVSLLYAAERRVSITSPYFVPDDPLLAAMVTAARRGVEVELFVGEIGDQSVVFHAQHSYYATLLDAGVRIHRFRAPAILHAKHMSVDDTVALVGSSNLDIRSFQLDLEVMVLICDRAFTTSLRSLEDEYRRGSVELTADEWRSRGRLHAILDDLARLTSALQ